MTGLTSLSNSTTSDARRVRARGGQREEERGGARREERSEPPNEARVHDDFDCSNAPRGTSAAG